MVNQSETEVERKKIDKNKNYLCSTASIFITIVILWYIWSKIYENEDYSTTIQQLIMFTITLEAIVLGIIILFIPKDPKEKFEYLWKKKGGVYTRYLFSYSFIFSIIFGVLAFCVVDTIVSTIWITLTVAIWSANTYYMIFRATEIISDYMFCYDGDF